MKCQSWFQPQFWKTHLNNGTQSTYRRCACAHAQVSSCGCVRALIFVSSLVYFFHPHPLSVSLSGHLCVFPPHGNLPACLAAFPPPSPSKNIPCTAKGLLSTQSNPANSACERACERCVYPLRRMRLESRRVKTTVSARMAELLIKTFPLMSAQLSYSMSGNSNIK